jgi:hypothetical protein
MPWKLASPLRLLDTLLRSRGGGNCGLLHRLRLRRALELVFDGDLGRSRHGRLDLGLQLALVDDVRHFEAENGFGVVAKLHGQPRRSEFSSWAGSFQLRGD